MLAIIDYGGGNLGSLLGALERRGAAFTVTSDSRALRDASGAILPGDGAFGATMSALRERGLDEATRDFVASGRPLLGICVGMQLLFERSTEHGGARGFGFFPGVIERLRESPRIPHIGWNRLELIAKHPFTNGLGHDEYAYFLHSYRAALGPQTLAATTHGERFSAVVARANVMGTQFHPEKSQRSGLLLLDNFIALTKGAS